MTELIASGVIIDLILALMVAEGILLWVHHRRTGQGLALADIALMLAAGACLMLAVRAALVGAGPHWIAACLAGSLVAHLADLVRRWRSAAGREATTYRTAPARSLRHMAANSVRRSG